MTINFERFSLYGLYLAAFNIVCSLFLVFWLGLNMGIDFKGGMLFEINTSSSTDEIRLVLDKNLNADFSLQELGENNFLIRIENDSSIDTDKVRGILSKDLNSVDYRHTESIGPKISGELISSSIYAVTMSIFAILFYLWIRFEWEFSLGAVLALIHDIVVTLGVIALFGLQFNISTIAAFLLILGYSINDTIVVYSRIRENIALFSDKSLSWVVNKSLNETISRTIITSVTTTSILLVMVLFGGSSLFDFCLTMLIGIIFGTYSSIFVASALLILISNNSK